MRNGLVREPSRLSPHKGIAAVEQTDHGRGEPDAHSNVGSVVTAYIRQASGAVCATS